MLAPPRQKDLQKRLAVASVIALAFFAASELLNQPRPLPDYQVRMDAAQLTARAQQAIRAEKVRRGIAMSSSDDPGDTGVIGPKFSPIVTDGSSIEVKRTAANPNLAAVVVAMLGQLDVQAGDKVTLLMTGSMPGANLAALAAVHTVGAKPTIIASVGPSMWGATDPAFTWLDMVHVVEAQKLMVARPLAATAGGAADDARGLGPQARQYMQAAAKRNGIPFYVPKDLPDAVEFRLRLLAREEPALPKVMINIGGGAASYGSAFNSVNAPASIIQPDFVERLQPRGVIHHMLSSGVPVINLHQITETASEYGLPIDMTGAVAVGQPLELYYAKTRPRGMLAILLVVLTVALAMVLRMGGVIPRETGRCLKGEGP